MRLGKVLDILYGTLINKPSISAFANVTGNIDTICNQTLFFLQDKRDLQKAIELGAYGIVFEGEIEVIDSEIAWIQVDNITQSIYRFVRYLALESRCTFLMCTPLEITFAESLHTPFHVATSMTIYHFLQDIFMLYLEHTTMSKHHASQILTCIRELENIDIAKIYSFQYIRYLSHYQVINENLEYRLQKFHVLSYTLFETKVIFDNVAYSLPIPYIFLPIVESLLSLLTHCNTFLLTEETSMRDIQQDSLFSNVALSQTMPCYHLKTLQCQILKFYFMDSKKRFSSIQKSKILLLCTQPELLDYAYVETNDYYYTTNISRTMQRILAPEKKQKQTNILVEYFKDSANYMQLLVCYPKNFHVGETSPKCVCIPYAHAEHLSQILVKIPFQLAIIYGISKNIFEQHVFSSKKLSEKTPPTTQSLFDF